MTLSNFDWTDKASVRWFILLPTGHEGPYDVNTLKLRTQKGLLNPSVQVWAEGLAQPVALQQVLAEAETKPTPEPIRDPGPTPAPIPRTVVEEEEEEPAEEVAAEELPPVPVEEVPPLPEEIRYPKMETPEASEAPERKSPVPYALIAVFFVVALCVLFTVQWLKSKESASFRRYPRMSPELHNRILSEMSFKGWGERIFFKEYVPKDLSHIWLVTSSFQHCDVEALFQSVKGKLLSYKDEQVTFTSRATLTNHVAEFSAFDFTAGSKIVPGLYELDVKAFNCSWDTLPAKVANVFRPVEKEYVARTKVVLFSAGAAEFNSLLDQLLKKKADEQLQRDAAREAFWDDLQQKFQTLLAIGLQIEQHFVDFLDEDAKSFRKALGPSIDSYTQRFGHFLTKFVVSNEEYFRGLDGGGAGRSKNRTYELMVNSTSKKLGMESMKIIEELQKVKSPTKAQLQSLKGRIKKTFAGLKADINEKIIQLSEDRSR